MDKLKLEPTAALVMQWALKLYDEEAVLRFVNRLDLSSGKFLLDRCNSVCKWYEEVILNRKSFIKHLIEQKLSTTEQKCQLVLLAAGKSPLPIEILLKNSSGVHRIFEIDVAGMDEKKRLYHELFPELVNKLQCITADIASSDIPGMLELPENGYRNDMQTIIIMEGISYYLHKQELKNIIASFQSGRESTFIIEYLVPYLSVDQARRSIPIEVFRIIQEYCSLEAISSYTKEELQMFFREKGGDLIAGYSMMDMELTRTGANTFFMKPGDGWIECVVGRVGTLQV